MITTKQIQALAEIGPHHLDQWRAAGIIDARSDRFTLAELFVIMAVADLIALGASLEAAARFAAWMRMEPDRGITYVDVEGFVVSDVFDARWILDLGQLREACEQRVATVTV